MRPARGGGGSPRRGSGRRWRRALRFECLSAGVVCMAAPLAVTGQFPTANPSSPTAFPSSPYPSGYPTYPPGPTGYPIPTGWPTAPTFAPTSWPTTPTYAPSAYPTDPTVSPTQYPTYSPPTGYPTVEPPLETWQVENALRNAPAAVIPGMYQALQPAAQAVSATQKGHRLIVDIHYGIPISSIGNPGLVKTALREHYASVLRIEEWRIIIYLHTEGTRRPVGLADGDLVVILDINNPTDTDTRSPTSESEAVAAVTPQLTIILVGVISSCVVLFFVGFVVFRLVLANAAEEESEGQERNAPYGDPEDGSWSESTVPVAALVQRRSLQSGEQGEVISAAVAEEGGDQSSGSGDEAGTEGELHGDGTEQCPICFDPLRTLRSRMTSLLAPCGHVLCTTCSEHIRRRAPCPVCRQPVLARIKRVFHPSASPGVSADASTSPLKEQISPAGETEEEGDYNCPSCQVPVVGEREDDPGSPGRCILAPCGHVLCSPCGARTESCPVCRTRVRARVGRVWLEPGEAKE
eukprot:TRINITY_DN22710_c0_g2_i1.p1 TRINITY_DN22710_c0_g2~~TRINITY_DN22710_c0_g2_i1.p1  ORF type:complete len:522 (+),score=76.59 TRINITY_DN22710_c0_g2_i1:94-1659(+)